MALLSVLRILMLTMARGTAHSDMQQDMYLPELGMSSMDLGTVSLLQVNLKVESAVGDVERDVIGNMSCREGPFEKLGSSCESDARIKRGQKRIRENNLTFLEAAALQLHVDLVRSIEAEGIPRAFVETGVAAGGSALLLGAAKRWDRCIHLYDTFTGMPPPTKRDGLDVHKRYIEIQAGQAGANYYGYRKDLLGFVQEQFIGAGMPMNGVVFHKGLFQETFHPTFEIAYAHLDGDWYDSTYHVLNETTPRLVLHGIMILDDTTAWSGAADAVDDFFASNLTAIPEGEHRVVQKDGKSFEVFQDVRMYVKRTV